MPSSQQNVSVSRIFPENSLSRDPQVPPLPVPQTHRAMFLSHKERNLHVNWHPPSEKTAFKNVRASGGEHGVNDVYNGNEISSWTEDQKNTTHSKTEGASQHGQVRCTVSG